MNHNTYLKKDIIEKLNLNLALEPIPEPIITYNVDMDGLFKDGSCDNATSSTILTTPLDKAFYLTGISFSVIKDATSTSVISRITGVKNGFVKYLAQIPGFTLTAQNTSYALSFKPIKLDPGTVINITNSTNVGNIKASAVIFYQVSEYNG